MALKGDGDDVNAKTAETGETGENESADEPSTTVPDNYVISLRGFETEDGAKQFSGILSSVVRALGRNINLSNLDGITVAYDYPQALLDLDRGYDTLHKLTPSSEMAFGIAMTPAVKRDGRIKSHIVLHAGVIISLADPESEHFGLALHILAHECAHVEAKHCFDTCFPGMVLQKVHQNAHEAFRWQIIDACWEEYIVTCISASIGDDPTEGYEETFSVALRETREKANNHIKAFRLHGNVAQVLAQVYGAYGELMRFASYLLGTMAGKELTLFGLPSTAAVLDGHWFSPHFENLSKVLSAIAAKYGKWTDLNVFETLGDLADEIVADGGLFISYRPNGQPYVDIPFTPKTMPNQT